MNHSDEQFVPTEEDWEEANDYLSEEVKYEIEMLTNTEGDQNGY